MGQRFLSGWPPGAPLPRLILLMTVTSALAVAEAAALEAAGMAGMAGLAPQISAPAAYAGFHDLRWILSRGGARSPLRSWSCWPDAAC